MFPGLSGSALLLRMLKLAEFWANEMVDASKAHIPGASKREHFFNCIWGYLRIGRCTADWPDN